MPNVPNPPRAVAAAAAAAPALPAGAPGKPISLTGIVSLNPGSTKTINTDAHRNPTNTPIAIHEIKFVSTTDTRVNFVNFNADGTSGLAPPTSSAILEATIKLGSNIITRSPTPVNLLGMRRSAFIELLNAGTVSNQVFGLSHQTWRLDHPIYLRPGQGLEVSIGHRNYYPAPVTARVTISGTFVKTLPKTMQLPYVASFVPPAFTPMTGTSDSLVRTSTERDLVNELDVPLSVRRFVGRVSSTYQDNALFDVLPDFNAYLITVNMRSVSGVPTVQRDTPFENVFDAQTAAWECAHLLPPKAYWTTTLKCGRTSANNGSKGALALPAIALHGTREVRT